MCFPVKNICLLVVLMQLLQLSCVISRHNSAPRSRELHHLGSHELHHHGPPDVHHLGSHELHHLGSHELHHHGPPEAHHHEPHGPHGHLDGHSSKEHGSREVHHTGHHPLQSKLLLNIDIFTCVFGQMIDLDRRFREDYLFVHNRLWAEL